MYIIVINHVYFLTDIILLLLFSYSDFDCSSSFSFCCAYLSRFPPARRVRVLHQPSLENTEVVSPAVEVLDRREKLTAA